jgi:hypothetical protein
LLPISIGHTVYIALVAALQAVGATALYFAFVSVSRARIHFKRKGVKKCASQPFF